VLIQQAGRDGWRGRGCGGLRADRKKSGEIDVACEGIGFLAMN
jgi:hypothetical protein